MNKRKTGIGLSGLSCLLFLACALQAWFDATDRSTHLRVYIYSAGFVIATTGLILRVRGKR
jgi:hypothetical protein